MDRGGPSSNSGGDSGGKSSLDNPATKKKPPKLRAINRSISVAIENYVPAPQMIIDDSQILEKPLGIVAAGRVSPVPPSLALPPALAPFSSSSSSTRHQHLTAHQQHQHHQHSSTSSPTASHTTYALPPPPLAAMSSSLASLVKFQAHHQPDIYLVSSSGSGGGGSSSSIRFDDYNLLPPQTPHSLKKALFRRSDTVDVHPGSILQMKKTHSFHAQDPTNDQDMIAPSTNLSASSSRRTSSVRGNYLFPHQTTKEQISRSPSPSRRGCRTHRSLNDPGRRPSNRTETTAAVETSSVRHPSLNDDILKSMDGHPKLLSSTNLSLENEIFRDSRSRSNSHTKIEANGTGSFEDAVISPAAAAIASESSLEKNAQHARQHSSHSLELDRQQHHHHQLALHDAATAATAAYHFKRGAKHAHSLYLSPKNLEELQIHRPAIVAAAAAFQGTNSSATVAGGTKKSLHSASVRLRAYRESLSASKKSKSLMGEGDDFELTSPHRRNSRPLSTPGIAASTGSASTDDIKRSPRSKAISLITSSAANVAQVHLIEEKRPSFERKPSLTYEIGDAAFEQAFRPLRHTTATPRNSSVASATHKSLKKKSLSEETDDEEESDRKRKRIACIIMTVFLCLVCASVFVVIITLTHSSETQVQNTTKKIYTFARETPVHYNVRQENERLMKESMERARFAKNFTDAASLASSGVELIP